MPTPPEPSPGAPPRGHTLQLYALPPQGEGSPGTAELSCRHCGTLNRVPRLDAAQRPARYHCGGCRGPLFLRDDEPFTGLAGVAYQHELDRQALAALQKVPGLDRAVKWVVAELGERSAGLFHLASSVQCGPTQLPRVHEIFRHACHRLDLPTVPPLYLTDSPFPNAITAGVQRPFVTVTSSLLERLDEQELLAVFAHELGHIQADHVLYKTLASVLSTAAVTLAQTTLGIGRLVLVPLQLALLKWDRCSELTGDRAALLATADPDVLVRVQMKLAGGAGSRYGELSTASYLAQARHLATLQQGSLLNQAVSLLQNVGRTHPFPVWRTHELLTWASEGDYLRLLAGGYDRR